MNLKDFFDKFNKYIKENIANIHVEFKDNIIYIKNDSNEIIGEITVPKNNSLNILLNNPDTNYSIMESIVNTFDFYFDFKDYPKDVYIKVIDNTMNFDNYDEIFNQAFLNLYDYDKTLKMEVFDNNSNKIVSYDIKSLSDFDFSKIFNIKDEYIQNKINEYFTYDAPYPDEGENKNIKKYNDLPLVDKVVYNENLLINTSLFKLDESYLTQGYFSVLRTEDNSNFYIKYFQPENTYYIDVDIKGIKSKYNNMIRDNEIFGNEIYKEFDELTGSLDFDINFFAIYETGEQYIIYSHSLMDYENNKYKHNVIEDEDNKFNSIDILVKNENIESVIANIDNDLKNLAGEDEDRLTDIFYKIRIEPEDNINKLIPYIHTIEKKFMDSINNNGILNFKRYEIIYGDKTLLDIYNIKPETDEEGNIIDFSNLEMNITLSKYDNVPLSYHENIFKYISEMFKNNKSILFRYNFNIKINDNGKEIPIRINPYFKIQITPENKYYANIIKSSAIKYIIDNLC